MFGFIIGTACLIGLIATLRRGRWGHWGHGYHAHGCGQGRYGYDGGGYGGGYGQHEDSRDHGFRGGFRGGFGRGFGFGPRAFLYRVLARLDATPAQERVIVAAVEEFRDTVRTQRGELRDSRKDVATAMRAEGFDAILLGDTFSRQDTKIEEVRKAFVGAIAKIHEALDERQRKVLADMIEGGFWS